MQKFDVMGQRAAGVLLPVFSLPSPYGVGTFGRAAYDWIDFLSLAGQKYWQVLPLVPTGFGDSPYQSFSAFAGNPYFVDLDALVEEELLTHEECTSLNWGKDEHRLDYDAVAAGRDVLLRKAFSRFKDREKLEEFAKKQAAWAEDYALFMAIKTKINASAWTDWDEDIRERGPKTISRLRERLSEDIDYHLFVQYKFHEQWQALKSYAGRKGIGIIGDIPIYVAMDSADTWGHRDIFLLDKDGRPTFLAGTPPDAFSKTGQFWGNPLYDWTELEARGYDWWIERMRACLELYDIVRIDHFRGFESFYSIPAESQTAMSGSWVEGPGMGLIKTLNKKLDSGRIIAEDLGLLTDEVRKLLKDSGYPGMKVLQFAFSPYEESDYLPHKHIESCVVYTGTHDNDTTRGWFSLGTPGDIKKALDYLGADGIHGGCKAFVRAALSSVAMLAIIPIADYLGLGRDARINTPSTLSKDNWSWRMSTTAASQKAANEILRLTKLYGRLSIPPKETPETHQDDET